jgi:hypothetical protein
VLSGEIGRLSSENINLSEEVNSCKLALSGETASEQRAEEQLSTFVLLFAEVEALRSRLRDSEKELESSRIQQLSRYRR